jgi:hypothetical protein
MKLPNRLSDRFRKWKLFSLLPGLLMARAALATVPLYQNYGILDYIIPTNPPPQIDAAIFDNENVFNVSFDEYSANPVFFETWNTVNYTNTGTMTANAPGLGAAGGTAAGAGFRFDTQTSNGRMMAGTFYNPGTIRCDSFLDGNQQSLFQGTESFSVFTIGECIVTATNVMNSGTIEAGVNSLIQFNGQNVDLTRGILNIENLQSLYFGNSPGVYSFAYGFGDDTNQDWSPGNALTATTAYSSLPYIITLTNSTAYFYFNFPSTNLTIIRAVFVQDTSPNVVTNHVYIDPDVDVGSFGFAPGAAHVEWIGTADNSVTCATITNYLYLTDDYVLGASTNVMMYDGTPDNFTFITSDTPLLFGPVPPLFYPVFPSGTTTNPYSYFDAQLVVTTTPTNATAANPSGALTNLPGRVQITASNELNLSLVSISGLNYMSLLATNQFDGSVGARIGAPYSDISLGVTNGFLVITNLLESGIPNWNGFVGAWSTRWLQNVTNTLDGTNFFAATNDYRVLIVRSSQLTPVTAPQVQNLTLHATNSLLITDVLNVFGSLFIDSQNLTLTTNGCGNGATSLDGELNLVSSAILWQSALPNMRNLTNNGAIRTKNLCVFGGPRPANYTNFINHGLISDQGSTIYANNFLSSGIISNGVGSFVLQSLATVLTNGAITAGGDVTITSGNLVASNLTLQAGRSLTLLVTNFLTDDGVSNGSTWSVGGSAIGGSDSGFNLLLLPANPAWRNDLLGTTVTNIAPPDKSITNTWAGRDYGISAAGYTNNMAIGRLILDSRTNASYSQFTFNGTGTSNAIYVDELILLNYASDTNHDLNGNLPALVFNTNLVIYYAQALTAGGGPGGSMTSVAEVLNHKNNDHLRWVWTYAGHFSSTNIVYPDGTTNGPFNAALAQSSDIDSDGDGLVNASDPTPFFVPSEVNFTETLTNRPPLSVRVQWATIPVATNYIYYVTNLTDTALLPFTNFDHYYYGANVAVTNSAHVNWFVSPQSYPGPATNVWVFDAITNGLRYYRVMVSPELAYPRW